MSTTSTRQSADNGGAELQRTWTNWFYHNPRLLLLVIALAVVAGLSSAAVMPRMEDPPLTGRGGQVTTLYPGADPERIETLVTDPIEEELLEIEEIKELRSSSRAGISFISIELRDDVYEVDAVWSRVRDRLSDAQRELPNDALESDFDEMEFKAYGLIVAVRWLREGPVNHAVMRRVSEELEDRLRGAAGTEQVDRFGDVEEEVLVELRPHELAARGLTVQAIASQLAASDAKTSAGQIRGPRGDLLVDVDSDLDSLARIRRTPVQFADGQAITRVGDVAEVSKSIAEPPASVATASGKRAIVLGAYVRPEVRIDAWRRDVQQVLDDFNATLPAGVDTQVLLDQDDYVATRLRTLFWNLVFGGAAVLLVIYLLMGASSAIVVGASLPLSAMLVLFGLRLLEIPIHQMSVTGLIIALGLLIDNAIVMVDDVGERMREGLAGGEAVADAVRRMATPLLGSTLTTALAFGPIALMPGPAGEFVGSIAVSVILAIASSYLLAMTVVPVLAAWGIRPQGTSVWSRGIHIPALSTWYRGSLRWVFRRPAAGLALGVTLPVLGFMQAAKLPEQFFPPADRDQFHIELELPASTSQQRTLALTDEVRNSLLESPAVEDVHWFVGESAPAFYYNLIPYRKGASQYAQALVQLNSAEQLLPLIQRLQRELDVSFPQARVLVRQLEQGPPFDAPVEMRLFGDDMEQLREAGDVIRGIMAATDGVIHTRSEVAEALPKLSLSPDEEAARLAGLDHQSLSRQLQASLDGALGGSVLEETEELPVRVRLPQSDRATLQQVRQLDFVGPSRSLAGGEDGYRGVPLSAVACPSLQPELAGIPHFNGRRVNEVKAYITAGMLPAEALDRFQKNWDDSGFKLPPGVDYEWGGETAKRDDAIGNLMANVGVLAVLMAATLVLSFGSFRIAGLIASVAALAVGLGLGALWVFGYPFGFMAIVGTMGLIGIAINDAIVVLACIRERGSAAAGDPEEMTGVVAGATRHVVATSLTTMAGFAPLVASGGGFWPPLAVAIAGGVGGATILALYYVPSAYILLMCPQCQPLKALAASDDQRQHAENRATPPPAQPAAAHAQRPRPSATSTTGG